MIGNVYTLLVDNFNAYGVDYSRDCIYWMAMQRPSGASPMVLHWNSSDRAYVSLILVSDTKEAYCSRRSIPMSKAPSILRPIGVKEKLQEAEFRYHRFIPIKLRLIQAIKLHLIVINEILRGLTPKTSVCWPNSNIPR